MKKYSRLSEARKEAVIVKEGRKAVLIKLGGKRIGYSIEKRFGKRFQVILYRKKCSQIAKKSKE